MKTKVINAQNIGELNTRLGKTMTGDFHVSLAIVFASPTHQLNEIIKLFSTRSIEVFGGTTAGEIANNDILEHAIVALLLSIDKEVFSIQVFPGDNFGSFTLGNQVGDWARSVYTKPAIMVLSAGLKANGEQITAGITSSAGSGAALFGGLSGDDLKMTGSFAFTGQQVLSNGVAALAFDSEKIVIKSLSVNGWKGVGTPKRITKSKENIVYEIDGEPAIDVYRKYFHISGDEKEQFYFAGEYPLKVVHKDGSTVVRNVMYADIEKKAIIYGGNVPEGAHIQFASPDIAQVIEQCIGQIDSFKQEVQIDTVAGIVLFSCAARHQSLGPLIKKEVELIRKIWNAPLAGFFSYGEIGNDINGKCEFNNNTLTLVLFVNTGDAKPGRMDLHQVEKEIIKTMADLELDAGLKAESHLLSKFDRARKEKRILLNFLHRTSEDLDQAMDIIRLEREKSEKLLLNILPPPIAERLKQKEDIIADSFNDVSILFSDIVGFTTLSSKITPEELVSVLNEIFGRFDTLAEKYGLEKIKTIGDAYLVVSGLPLPRPDHADALARMALDMRVQLAELKITRKHGLEIRIGLHAGPVVAGVIGHKKFAYDLWGDAVNTASRMESHSIPGHIHCSADLYEKLKDKFEFEKRSTIQVKGKGDMETYFLKGVKPVKSQ
jgi:class 3 adenylate cyclase